MKFAHALKEALIKDGYPPHWVAVAVPYGQLKKCLKKAKRELESLGLDESTIAQLTQRREQDEAHDRRGSAVGLQYEVDGKRKLIPKLTLRVQFNNGVVEDVTISPNTRQYLETLAANQDRKALITSIESADDPHDGSSSVDLVEQVQDLALPNNEPGVKFVDVPLAFTKEFFDILYEDVAELDKLQIGQQKELGEEIVALSSRLGKLTRPSKTMFHKSDLYAWRKLFDLYVQSNIFFSTRELDRGKRNAIAAGKQLQWFQDQVTKNKIIASFKLPSSHEALEHFISINAVILLSLKFQELNKQAVSKILKKYDKSTMLGAGKTFPILIKNDTIMSGKMAKDLCAQISTDIVKIVPQPGDHECPICSFIAYRPVRMQCGHIFCLHCSIKLQHSKKRFCPMCRENVILLADIDNLDENYGKWLETNFPKECREARIEIEKADGIEKFGPGYKHPSETKCHVM